MGKHVRLLITALIVALLLGSVLTSAAFAQGPYSLYYVPGYGTGSLSTSVGESWYFTYYRGAPGYSPLYTPGTLGYSYANPYPFGPLYGQSFGYPYNYGFSRPCNAFPSCWR